MKRVPLKNVAFDIDGQTLACGQEQLEKLNKWLAEVTEKIDEKHRGAGMGDLAEHFKGRGDVYAGASGGNLTFSFTPTGLGTVCKVTESITGEVIDLTDYDNW